MLPHKRVKADRKNRTNRWSVSRILKFWVTSEDGSGTVDTVLWMPFFVGLFALIVDGTMIFNNQSNVLRIVHDANRGLSVGRYESGAEAEKVILANTAHISANIKVKTAVVDGVIQTVALVPVADLDLTGAFSGIAGATLTINAQHYMEL